MVRDAAFSRVSVRSHGLETRATPPRPVARVSNPCARPGLLAMISCVALLCSPARGQTGPTANAIPGDFDKGAWTLSLYAGYDRECSHDPQMGYVATGVGYFFSDGMSVNAEARAYGVSQDDVSDAALFELDLLFRHHFLRRDNWTLFFDVSAGVSQATRAVPGGGTHFNFIEETGLGATYRLGDGVHLIGGVRYWHLSNAKIHGEDKNPGLNGYGAYVGLMWRI